MTKAKGKAKAKGKSKPKAKRPVGRRSRPRACSPFLGSATSPRTGTCTCSVAATGAVRVSTPGAHARQRQSLAPSHEAHRVYCEGGMRAPCVIRWPGHIKPGTVFNEIFSSLDWVPTFVEIAGGPKGNELKKQIEAGKYPGIVKTTLDGVNQIDYLTGKSDKSARDTFLYYSGKDPSAVRYKN